MYLRERVELGFAMLYPTYGASPDAEEMVGRAHLTSIIYSVV
jgi:hypothetical protein